jgi:acyl dehydratase
VTTSLGEGMSTPPIYVTAPPDGRWHYEDLDVGESIDVGRRGVTREEIVAFAAAFDPQAHHLDDEAAAKTMVGRLCASGWHTCSMSMRLLCDGFFNHAAGLGSPGMDEIRWVKPVYPDDTIRGRIICVARRPLASRPGVGLWTIDFELTNQDGAVVMTWRSSQLMGMRRPGGEA